MADSRTTIERLLEVYLSAVSDAAQACSEYEYQPHVETAHTLLFRWQAGESLDAMKDALRLEQATFIADPPPGKEAELVGRAFGDVWRACGMRTSLSGP